MKIKFTTGGAAAFGAFDGLQRTCVRFVQTGRKNVYRCKEYENASHVGKHPKKCAPGLISRSPGLIRMRPCGKLKLSKADRNYRSPKKTCASHCSRLAREGRAHGRVPSTTRKQCMRMCKKRGRR